jgi:hypothetical protein
MKKAIDPELSGIISELERLLHKLKERLKEQARDSDAKSFDQIARRELLPAPQAFGRSSCANMSLRPSQKPAVPIVHPELGSL